MTVKNFVADFGAWLPSTGHFGTSLYRLRTSPVYQSRVDCTHPPGMEWNEWTAYNVKYITDTVIQRSLAETFLRG